MEYLGTPKKSAASETTGQRRTKFVGVALRSY